MKVPGTYAEWVELLNVLNAGTDDEEALKAAKQGTIEWQAGVADRFSKKLVAVINNRMNLATDRFQTALNRGGGQERSIIEAMIALRKQMKFLSEAVDLPAIPEEIRNQYRQLVLEQADAIQKSLEDSASKDRGGKLLSIVRNNKVNAF